MADVYEIADRYVETLAEMYPVAATFIGIAGHDARMSDYSPDASNAMADAQRKALAEMRAAEPKTERERICRDTFIDEVSLSIEEHDAHENLRNLNIMHSPAQALRMVFDMMPLDTEEQWANIASRLENLDSGLKSHERSLALGADTGLVVSQRQVSGTIAQIDTWSGAAGGESFGKGFLARFDEGKHGGPSMRARLEKAADTAAAAFNDYATFLREKYLPVATSQDGVGHDRYMLYSRGYNGIALDLKETYEWGWEQARWVQSEMEKTAWRIKPEGSVAEVVELLETDPQRAISGVDEFRHWMQDLQDQTIADFDGKHFDLDPRVRRIEAMIAPPGGQLAMYYTGPSEDFSRPGRTWYPTGGKTVFPIWREVSVAFHEGVPGHHFQIATTKTLAEDLSRYQRMLAGTSGYIEGWALYAERLMGELGYLENPDYYMGMLDSQALRSVRVVVDIGMHLGLKIPSDSEFHPGEVWTPQLAFEFMRDRVHFPADFVASEVDRYLGIPGQAISYKVGERVWLEARETARRRSGEDFDLKAWHNAALHLGPMGLAQMKREMATEG